MRSGVVFGGILAGEDGVGVGRSCLSDEAEGDKAGIMGQGDVDGI